MRLNRSNLRPSPIAHRPSRLEAGVALVITVVMISIITFLAVAFLTLTGRERGSVRTTIDAATARNATDVANDRAKAELIAGILASANIANVDTLVSTNFVNWNGFDPAPGVFNQLTNVNYEYLDVGGALNLAQSRQNLTNLFYNPRPPVYITNRLTGGYEFRYYIDLNRNGRFENTGYWPVTNLNGSYYDAFGGTNTLYSVSNLFTHVIGDPQWIGGLDRSDKTHSADNQFLYRYAYIVVPEGKTLDINYIHNAARAGAGPRMNAFGRDYFRNQGAGTWEINFAAFLYDLNTNSTYGWGGGINGYDYDFPNLLAQGNAFADALGLYRYRVNGLLTGTPADLNYNLATFGTLYGNPAALLFQSDRMDGYTDGNPIGTPQTTINPFPELGGNMDNTKNPWVGANHPFHFFTTQDFFDPRKANRNLAGAGMKFTDRLYASSTNISTYDQSTFYRMLSQIGTDSATEDDDRLNLNYVNVRGLKVTNFVSWTDPNYNFLANFGVRSSELFFTNAVDRLLKKTTERWFRAGPSNYLATYFGYYGYTNLDEVGLTNRPYFGMTNQVPSFGVTDIPVVWEGRDVDVYSPIPTRTGNRQFVYNQSIHRILQVAANIWDTKTNTRALQGLPTVFRPRFKLQGGNLTISDFVEEEDTQSMATKTGGLPILDIFGVTNLTTRIPADGDVLIYGVPPVVGARKGLPNFNQFQADALFTMTRKLQIRKEAGRVTETNQLFTMALTMPTAAEFWNSYASNYTGPVSIFVTNYTSLTITNDLGVQTNYFFTTGDRVLNTNNWRGFREGRTDSFVVMMRTNVPFLTNSAYLPIVGERFRRLTPVVYDTSKALLMPRWGLTISNRVHAMILRPDGKIVDYVLLGNLTYSTNWTDIIAKPPTVGTDDNIAFEQLWATNAYTPNPIYLSGSRGVHMQLNISLGYAGNPLPSIWEDYLKNDSTDTVDAAIRKFNAFYTTSSSNGYWPVPFSASVQFRVPLRWEANDPLVHYMADDLLYVRKSGLVEPIMPLVPTPTAKLEGIGGKNERYQPWPSFDSGAGGEGDTEAIDRYNPSMKDPLVRSSDDWNFPTNVLPTVGWLGRVHRGSPWQTVYLKSANLGLGGLANSMTNWLANITDQSPQLRWANHVGSKTAEASFYNRPVVDHSLFDVFTTAINENSTRGQLPINQTNLASWSAVLSGMAVLTNIGATLTNIGGVLTTVPLYDPLIIQPAGIYDLANPFVPVPPIVKIVSDINATRANTNLFPNGSFGHMADILSVPSLSFGDPVFIADDLSAPFPRMGTYYWTNESPFLNFGVTSIRERSDVVPVPTSPQIQNTLNDAAYEWVPQQAMSLLQLGKPRFVIYAYGQSLQPAPNSIVTAGGPFFGLCTNYTITAEQVTRTVVEIEGGAKTPRVVVKSYNILGPD